MTYVAAWSETGHGNFPVSGSWVGKPWEQARAILVGQLQRNIDRWSDEHTRPEYEAALNRLRTAEELPSGELIFRLRDHFLLISQEDIFFGRTRP